jgi:hypothetical protein
MIFAPTDVNIIEFNEFPDDISNKFKDKVRKVFLNAFWNIGGSGKFYVIEPYLRHGKRFYAYRMKISLYEIFKILQNINVLKKGFNINLYPIIAHKTYFNVKEEE